MASSSSSTLRDRMKARRMRMKDTMDTMDESPSYTRAEPAFETAQEGDESVEQLSAQPRDILSDDEQAEQLAKKLRKRHRKTQRELDQAVQPRDDIDDMSHQLSEAKKRTKKRIQEESLRSGDITDGSMPDSIPNLRGDSETDEVPDSEEVPGSPLATTRSGADSPRKDTTTPRKFSTTLGQNYRQKLIEKRRAAKDKAKDDVYEDSRQTGRLLAGKRSMPRVTRFDDPSLVRMDDKELEQELEKSLVRSKWKQAGEKVGKLSSLPTVEESYDFFTKQFEAEPEKDEPATREDGEREDGEPGPSAAGAESAQEIDQAAEEAVGDEDGDLALPGHDDTTPLLDDELDVDSWRFYRSARAEYQPFRERLKAEEKILFSPSIREAPAEQKIFGADNPRFLEDEGFYVGEKPLVPNRNVHKMENRLLKQNSEGAKKWFGEDGRLIALPDPLKDVPSRPYIVEEVEPQLQTDYHKAILQEFDSRFIDGSIEGKGRYQLDVDLNTVAFTHHHLFSREHVLASRLTQQYAQYVLRNKKKAADYFTEKLQALKAAASHVQDTIAAIKADKRNKSSTADQETRLKEYKYEIRQTRKLRDSEWKADRTLLKNIIQSWKEMKALRTFQTCVNTNIKLQIRK